MPTDLSKMSNAELVAEYVRRGGEAPKNGKFRDKQAGIRACESLTPCEVNAEQPESGLDVAPEPLNDWNAEDIFSVGFVVEDEKAEEILDAPVIVGKIDPNDTLQACAERRGVASERFRRSLPENPVIFEAAQEQTQKLLADVFAEALGFDTDLALLRGDSVNFSVRFARAPRKHQPRVTRVLKLARRARRRQVAAYCRAQGRRW